jgi:tripartite ATP-independent transporter DctM subunit
MSASPPVNRPAESAPRPLPAWLRRLRSLENGAIVFVLAGLAFMPIGEALLRKLANTGIAGASVFAQHFTLLVGVLGGAIAAREGRLLSLSTLTQKLPGRWKFAALVFSNAAAAAISVVLCAAGWKWIQVEPADKILAYGIPYRAFQLFLPLGYIVVALRLCWLASPRWTGRVATMGLTGLLVLAAVNSPFLPEHLLWPALIGLAVATVLGAPLFTTLGGAAMILLWGTGREVSLIPLEHYYLVTDAVLPSIPLFTLAGYFLAEGGASKRLVRVFLAVVGQFRGGPGIVTALVCAFFTAFTGASGVTVLALGGLLMPVLLQARYSENNALGLVTGAGSLGLLFPPCLPLILYAIIAQRTIQNLEFPEGAAVPEVSINSLFLGGIGPGILLVGMTALWAIRAGPKDCKDRPAFRAREAAAAVWAAKWELLLPVLVIAAMLLGWATPVEAAALSALYAFLTQTVIHRDLNLFKEVPRVMTECGMIIGGVLLILGVAMGLTKYLILADAPTAGVEWVKATVHSPWVFLLLLNLFLLVVGCLMDIYSAIVVVVPLIVPMGLAFGIDPIHLGIVFLANLQLGFLTPPVGMNLFLASYRFNKPMSTVTRATFPMMVVLGIGVALITYWPALTTWLPKMVK